ncbi:MFS transporter [Leifsonia bigeumensis]|uniref:MFS transporter n=1 Tax=Leifsonella bigeumensis TaxID=433643 RepID=A0ABP7EY86_9MICO
MTGSQGDPAPPGLVSLRTDIAAFAGLTGWGYFPVAFVGRVPFAMMIIGVLTMIATVRESVAEAGVAAACAGIGTAVLGPSIGWLADRFGERTVLLMVSVMSIATVGLFLALVLAGAHFILIAVVAGLLGGTTPQVSPFSRARLAGIAARPRSVQRRTRAVSVVMSYESAMDEASFVIGPVLVGLLTAFFAPWAPLALGAMLTAFVVVAFALHPTARRMPAAESGRIASTAPTAPRGGTATLADGRVLTGRILVLSTAMALVGAIFGTILTALTEFMRTMDAGEQTGIVYGAMSAGAILSAIVIVAIPPRVTLEARWIVFAGMSTVGAVALACVTNLPWAVGALFLCGCGVGASLVTLFSLGAAASPVGRSATVMTMLQSSLVVGQAVAAAVGGFIVQGFGSSVGFWTTAIFALALVVVAVLHSALVGTPRGAVGVAEGA